MNPAKLAWSSWLAALLLAGCVSFSDVQPGQSMAEVEKAVGAPAAKRSEANGEQVWEYDLGPEGRRTWMVEFGPDGRVRQARQVLTDENFLNIRAGQSDRADILTLLGRPNQTIEFSRLREDVWDYRYFRDTWRMIMSVHFDNDTGKVKYYTTVPDPAYYERWRR